ncbi:hypothetical protein Scep_006490 [Stephania cephalantha]|uniref:BAG family molecular chaperone regulator 1 n=1 Tax=Stephania cephalantha TaxID=152367 RepID=A0AAP0K809_9MAGN
MMRMRSKGSTPAAAAPSPKSSAAANNGRSEEVEWEMRPGGMLVQKRTPESDRASLPPPTIRVRVKHGSSSSSSSYHEIYINSQATFGELKKMLAGPSGVHPQDQKLMFKDKERDSNAYLDVVGVKERSKIVLLEDPTSQERRFLEMRKAAKMEKASKSVSEISLEVDKLAGQVSGLESVISRGGKVAETQVLNLIELLMNQLIKLDGIIADGDVKLQRRMQVKRVQKYVETLDLLKIKNAMSSTNGVHQNSTQQNQQRHSAATNGAHKLEQRQVPAPRRQSSTGEVVVTTKWETFEAAPPLIPYTSSAPTATTRATATATATAAPANKLNWEFFD